MLNGKQMAAALGLAESMVSRLRQRGMPMDTLENAVRWRGLNLDPARTKGMRMDTAAQGQLAPAVASSGAGAAPGAAAERVDDQAQVYRENRARFERVRADRAEIELRLLRHELVAVAEVELLEFTAARIVRDRLEMLPPRAAADLRAIVIALVPEAHRAVVAAGLDLHEFERRLASLVRQALADASKEIEDSRQDDDA